jgi:hypothetical protein
MSQPWLPYRATKPAQAEQSAAVPPPDPPPAPRRPRTGGSTLVPGVMVSPGQWVVAVARGLMTAGAVAHQIALAVLRPGAGADAWDDEVPQRPGSVRPAPPPRSTT